MSFEKYCKVCKEEKGLHNHMKTNTKPTIGTTTTEKKLTVLKIGALAIQVCTNAKTKKEIERLTNEADLCGTVNGWILDEKESKRLGQAKVACADDPTRTHYILYA